MRNYHSSEQRSLYAVCA